MTGAKLISIKIPAYLDLEGSIESAITELTTAKKTYEAEGFTALELMKERDCSCYGACDCGKILVLYGKRPETFEETVARLESAVRTKAVQEVRDRETFERLKAQGYK